MGTAGASPRIAQIPGGRLGRGKELTGWPLPESEAGPWHAVKMAMKLSRYREHVCVSGCYRCPWASRASTITSRVIRFTYTIHDGHVL